MFFTPQLNSTKFNFIVKTHNGLNALVKRVNYDIPISSQTIWPNGFNNSQIKSGQTINLLLIAQVPSDFNIDLIRTLYSCDYFSKFQGSGLANRFFYKSIQITLTKEDVRGMKILFQGYDIDELNNIIQPFVKNINNMQSEIDSLLIDFPQEKEVIGEMNEVVLELDKEIQKAFRSMFEQSNSLYPQISNLSRVTSFPNLMKEMYNFNPLLSLSKQTDLKRETVLDNKFPIITFQKEMNILKEVSIEEINEDLETSDRLGKALNFEMRDVEDNVADQFDSENDGWIPERHQLIKYSNLLLRLSLEYPEEIEEMVQKIDKDPNDQISVLLNILTEERRSRRMLV